MFKRVLWRLLVGICFAFPLGILAAVSVQAQEVEEEDTESECIGCHEITQTHWEESAHGQAYNDPVFQKAWREQNSPDACLECHTTGFDKVTGIFQTENVSCSVCHGPEIGEHPEEIMPTDISSRLCGTCHLDSHADWESSSHGQEDLACVRCHNAHTTELRTDGVQDLCRSCHNDAAHFYNDTAHANEGLLCSDCHLRVSDATLGDGHAQRQHTFIVDLDTCADCHSDDMHYPQPAGKVHEQQKSIEEETPALAIGSMQDVQQNPDPVGPMGFAVLASLVGMGFGIIAAPWLTKWNRSVEKRQDNE
ncbi:MAG: multiheme c-type cytochrome [Candidatus Promineifilaceae bacterium]|nr:multiheme c-type cytochrome [Candidatus Promineifilaceae bacterium]